MSNQDYQNKDRLSVCSYSYYSENLNWAAQKPSTGPHAARGLDIAGLDFGQANPKFNNGENVAVRQQSSAYGLSTKIMAIPPLDI